MKSNVSVSYYIVNVKRKKKGQLEYDLKFNFIREIIRKSNANRNARGMYQCRVEIMAGGILIYAIPKFKVLDEFRWIDNFLSYWYKLNFKFFLSYH